MARQPHHAKRKQAGFALLTHARSLWAHNQRGFVALTAVAALAGVGLAGIADEVTGYTNTNAFCISCHEMKSTVYREYQQTVHYRNASGVRASCADCHVPRAGPAKLWRKIAAAKDVWHHLAGTIDSPEKFEEHRADMANTVWRYMRDSDSRECRSCHDFPAMKLDEQRRRPRRKHAAAMQSDETCIDCHQGIAHRMPREDAD